jgi:hypothetical protein
MHITFPDEPPPRVEFTNRSVEFDAVIDGERVVNRVPIEILDSLAKFDTSKPPREASGARDAAEVLALFARYRDKLRDLARQAIEDGRTNASGGADILSES